VKEEKNMKTPKLPITALTILVAALTLSACGKTKRADFGSGEGGPVTIEPEPCFNCGTDPIDPIPADPVDPQPTNPPLSYEFTLKGNQIASTGNITTDNVLKVKFRVTAEQGNHVHKATELKVTIAMGGTEVTPTYTANNYTYGMVGETSNVIDLSSYVTPGHPVQLQVKRPMNDFYCTYMPSPFWYWDPNTYSYQPVNPQYNSYPGCRKEVFVNSSNSSLSHNWSGVLLVQTSSTQAIP
jgi:hypothetical protein